MWKYIVTFCLITWISDPCPDKIPGCLVIHSHAEFDCGHYKTFFDRDSAFNFYNEGNKEVNENYCNTKIDSIEIKL